MRIIVAGSRTVTEEQVFEALRCCPWINFASAVVSGMAKGADTFGEKWATQRGVRVYHFPADWKTLGKRAGPVRNKQMAENAEGLVVVWDGESRGTRSMIDLAKRSGLQIFCVLTKTGEVVEVDPAGHVAALWEIAQERAAMMEFSGERSRAEAEREAGLTTAPSIQSEGVATRPAASSDAVFTLEAEAAEMRIVKKAPKK